MDMKLWDIAIVVFGQISFKAICSTNGENSWLIPQWCTLLCPSIIKMNSSYVPSVWLSDINTGDKAALMTHLASMNNIGAETNFQGIFLV